jgi:hypothetical protein
MTQITTNKTKNLRQGLRKLVDRLGKLRKAGSKKTKERSFRWQLHLEDIAYSSTFSCQHKPLAFPTQAVCYMIQND